MDKNAAGDFYLISAGDGKPVDWALAYARAGLRVFPCNAGREPLCGMGGFHKGTTDSAVIRQWWTLYPHAEIGWTIEPGLIVLDLDEKSGRRGLRDYEALAGISAHDTVTPQASTPTGGRHLVFAWNGEHARQFAGRIPGHPGIDTRVGGKGYVILPGPGNGRRWIRPLSTPLAPVPQWACVREAPLQSNAIATLTKVSVTTPFVRYATETSLRAIVKRVERATEGERNSVLFWGACRVGELVREGLLGEEWAAELLALAATHTGLSDLETRRTIESGFRTISR
jgi:hypothetical protein